VDGGDRSWLGECEICGTKGYLTLVSGFTTSSAGVPSQSRQGVVWIPRLPHQREVE